MEITTIYNLLKSFHIISMTTWMAGLFYLPRLFVYHSSTKKDSNQYQTFIVMERKLFLYIMNPSLILTWLLGTALIYITNSFDEIWLSVKIILVMFLTVFHIYCGKVIKIFKKKENTKKEKYYRVINEIPTIIFITIIFLVVFKPLIDS
tara:strand:- start:211 stop:657 length:447 start_codon:yes stop_codon:yes gene_type:complete